MPEAVAMVLLTALVTGIVATVFWLVSRFNPISERLEQAWWRRQHPQEVAAGNAHPIEELARDLRRLRRSLTMVDVGVPMARRRGIVLAYDDVLCEVAHCLEVPHMIVDLPLGSDRDLERLRVESCLEAAGVPLDP